MQKNVGTVDKAIRYVVAVVLAVLIITKVITGTLAIVLGILAGMLVLTSLLSWCCLYTILGISTRKSGGSSEDQGSKGCGCGCH